MFARDVPKSTLVVPFRRMLEIDVYSFHQRNRRYWQRLLRLSLSCVYMLGVNTEPIHVSRLADRD